MYGILGGSEHNDGIDTSGLSVVAACMTLSAVASKYAAHAPMKIAKDQR
jgi:hypothetical protein